VKQRLGLHTIAKLEDQPPVLDPQSNLHPDGAQQVHVVPVERAALVRNHLHRPVRFQMGLEGDGREPMKAFRARHAPGHPRVRREIVNDDRFAHLRHPSCETLPQRDPIGVIHDGLRQPGLRDQAKRARFLVQQMDGSRLRVHHLHHALEGPVEQILESGKGQQTERDVIQRTGGRRPP
jgi:hypothetical protein